MSDIPIAFIAFLAFQAFVLFAFGYLIGAWHTLRDIKGDDDER